MTDLAINQTQMITPDPRISINIRAAVVEDLPFIDELQKLHAKQVGFLAKSWIENYIRDGNVLIAEEGSATLRVASDGANHDAERRGTKRRGTKRRGTSIGYCIYRDRYLKREELGIIMQLNVSLGEKRKLVGAALVKAAFERCPYGVRLFCCWCAQDIEANYFWESLGFVPLAFRTGSEKKERIHIFWQRRIRERDEVTPYWFPSQTSGGAIREDRLAIPIPPGTHWSDVMPLVLPGVPGVPGGPGRPGGEVRDQQNELTSDLCPPTSGSPSARGRRKKKKKEKVVSRPRSVSDRGGLRFAPPEPPPVDKKSKKKQRKKRPRKEKQKNDPKLVAAARELRDRYLEEFNSGNYLPETNGKYDVSRPRKLSTDSAGITQPPDMIRLLDAA